MPTDLPRKRSVLSRLIESYNPGVTMLVAIWVIGYTTRQYLIERGMLTQIGDEALLSLLYVVPVMLVGWGLLTLFDPRRSKDVQR